MEGINFAQNCIIQSVNLSIFEMMFGARLECILIPKLLLRATLMFLFYSFLIGNIFWLFRNREKNLGKRIIIVLRNFVGSLILLLFLFFLLNFLF